MPVYISTKILIRCIICVTINRNTFLEILVTLLPNQNSGAHHSNFETFQSLYLPNCWSNFHEIFTKHHGL